MTNGPVAKALAARRSVRAYLDRSVSREVVEEILSAASRAPSGTNMQPWRVYVVAGEAKAQLCKTVLERRAAEPHRERRPNPYGEYLYNPEPLFDPFLERRRRVGWELYRIMGVAKGDRAASWRESRRNFEFFGAPVGMIFTIDRRLTAGSFLDYGIFLQSIMLAAQDYGLDTCAQAAWRHYHDVLRARLRLPLDEIVVCGMALGYADLAVPANALRSEREPVSSFSCFFEELPEEVRLDVRRPADIPA